MWPPVPRQWPGETVYVVAGGPSALTQNVARLEGRRVIAVNSSWEIVPFADVLFFGDDRWWREYCFKVLSGFKGRICTCRPIRHSRICNLRNSRPKSVVRPHPGMKPLPFELPADRSAVPMRRTSTAPAMVLAYHLGASRIVLLGADGKFSEDGRRNNYTTVYPEKWKHREGCWDLHRQDLSGLAEAFKGAGVEVLNASPGSAWDLWPIVTLDSIG